MGRELLRKVDLSVAETTLPEKKTLRALRGVFLNVEQTHHVATLQADEGSTRMTRMEERIYALEEQLQT